MQCQLETLITPVIELCRQAGAEIRSRYNELGDRQWQQKADNSPVTQADLASHQLLSEGLQGLLPGLPLLSEESPPVGYAERESWHQYWLVDPLDGTREFLRRTGDITINIALIDDHRPVMGVLYLPLQELAYCGVPGVLARCYDVSKGLESRPLATSKGLNGQQSLVLTGRGHSNPQLNFCLQWLEACGKQVEKLECGAALKFCYLAEGRGDLYPRFRPCSEWDTAAGQAVLEAAGGALLDLQGKPVGYNLSDSLISPNFIAVADASLPLWGRLLEELAGNTEF